VFFNTIFNSISVVWQCPKLLYYNQFIYCILECIHLYFILLHNIHTLSTNIKFTCTRFRKKNQNLLNVQIKRLIHWLFCFNFQLGVYSAVCVWLVYTLYNHGGGSCTRYGVVILVYSILKRQDFLTRTAHMAFNTETLTCEDECEHM
jgi:hypothetical protein